MKFRFARGVAAAARVPVGPLIGANKDVLLKFGHGISFYTTERLDARARRHDRPDSPRLKIRVLLCSGRNGAFHRGRKREHKMKAHSIWTFAISTLFGLLAFGPARAQQPPKRGPSTSEERARAVKVAHELEEDPLAKEASENRKWVIQWIVDIPDITVTECDDYFGKIPKIPRGHMREIVSQMVISSAAFMIEHPDKAKDDQAVATAGLLGALKAYQSILREEPDARWPYVDKVVQMRDQGKLDDYVSDTRRKCAQEEEEEPDPDTMRAAR